MKWLINKVKMLNFIKKIMDLVISDQILKKAEITAEELLLEIAIHLYDTERLSIGQARNLAELDHLSFQKELSKRNIYIKYDIEDLETDLDTFKYLENKKASWG